MSNNRGAAGAGVAVERVIGQLVDRRSLGGDYSPDECARRLSCFSVVETLLLRSMAGWVVRCPELDVKIELGRQVAFAAERADALLQRVSQLLWPAERDVLLHPAVAALLDEANSRPQSTAGLLAGWGGVVLPRLLSAYDEYVSATDAVSDAPTLRLIVQIRPDVAQLADWMQARLDALLAAAPATAAEAQEQNRRLQMHWQEANAAGGLTAVAGEGQGVGGQGVLQRQGEPLTDGVARDGRFRDMRPGESPPPEPLDRPEGRLAYLMRTLNFELFACEMMGRNLYEYGGVLPWQFTLDMARQCWDEARHAEMMVKRLELLGQLDTTQAEPYPLDNGPWHDIYPGGLFQRLVAMNRGIEGLALDAHVHRAGSFTEVGDIVGAGTHIFIVADEAPHVGFGNRWLRYLLRHDSDPDQTDLALIPFFPVMGQQFAPKEEDSDPELAAAEQEAWEAIAARRAVRLHAAGIEDFALGLPDATGEKLGPGVLGVRRGFPVNLLARRLAGFTPADTREALAAAEGKVAVPDA